jgi:hypothetical protein
MGKFYFSIRVQTGFLVFLLGFQPFLAQARWSQSSASQSRQIETRLVPPAPPPVKGQTVGRQAASRYLLAQTAEDERQSEFQGRGASGGRLFTLGLGSFLSSRAYQWSSSDTEDSIGRMVYGFSYDFSDWNHFDFTLRVQYQEYQVRGERISKLSFQPSLSLPQSKYKFPVYFGAGLGGGIFFNQPQGESPLSLDYKLFVGLRVADLIDRTGFLVEWALENHLHAFSDGQMVGQTLMAGLTFSF